MRPALCEEALRSAGFSLSSHREEPDVHGLVALMEIQASRTAARPAPSGEPILLMRSEPRALGPPADSVVDSRRWRAARPWRNRAGPTCCRPPSPPVTRGPSARAETDWLLITALYQELAQVSPSPVMELNRAVAIAMAHGPAAGLALTDQLAAAGCARLSPAAERAWRFLPSSADIGRRARNSSAPPTLTQNERERRLLLDRAAVRNRDFRGVLRWRTCC